MEFGWKSSFSLGDDCKMGKCFLINLLIDGKLGLNVSTKGKIFLEFLVLGVSNSILGIWAALENTWETKLAESWSTKLTLYSCSLLERKVSSEYICNFYIFPFCNIYLCDFAKRCPLRFLLKHGHRPCSSQCSRKKTRGLAVLLGVIWELWPRPIRGWVASLFWVKTRGVGRGDFVTLVRVSCQKAVQSQRIFPVA